MNLSVHAIVFLGLLVIFQSILIFWSFHKGASPALVFLVALLPVVGVPALLYLKRSRIKDNHIAGALTYLVLLVTAFCFIALYPNPEDDLEIPWALIHTMQFFGFLGLANLVLAPLRDDSEL